MPSFLKIAKDSKNPVLNEWAIIGKGDLGSKAEDLMLRAVQIREAGFQTSSRQVYTTDTYFSFLEHNGVFSAMDSGARPAALRKLIISGTFTDSEMHDIHNTAATFQTPLVVRSSAYGDSRGTGSAGSSIFCANNSEMRKNAMALAEAMKSVFASTFETKSIRFREKTGLPLGLALMIEPVVGRVRNGKLSQLEITPEKYFGPLCGGAAYTSTPSLGTHTVLSAGIPIGAVLEEGLMVNDRNIEAFSNAKTWLQFFMRNDSRAADIEGIGHFNYWIKGQWLHMDTGTLRRVIIREMKNLRNSFMEVLFRNLKKLEELTGTRQYVEWALIQDEKQPLITINQIADAEIMPDSLMFNSELPNILWGNCVVGTGKHKSSKIVHLKDSKGLDQLREYNEFNKGYTLIYNGHLSSSAMGSAQLKFEDFHNAAVAIELLKMSHQSAPISHFHGTLEESGILFFVAANVDWSILEKHLTRSDDSFAVYNAKVSVIASTAQQRASLSLME